MYDICIITIQNIDTLICENGEGGGVFYFLFFRKGFDDKNTVC